MSYKPIAIRVARRYFRNPRDAAIFVAQMGAEANFRDATSPAGAQGPAQIMPATARGWGVRNVHDPVEAYSAAAKNMKRYLAAYKGDWRKALAAYNAGPGAVAKYGGVPPFGETQAYVKKILGGAGAHRSAVRGGGGGSTLGTPGRYTRGQAPLVIPGRTTVDKSAALVDALLASKGEGGLLKRWKALIDTGNYTTTTDPQIKPGKPAEFKPGQEPRIRGAGGGATGGKAPGKSFEFFYDPQGGWDNGKRVGAIGGHGTHGHFAGTPDAVLWAGRLAKEMGLHVSENAAFGDRVDPVHTDDSFHYRKGRSRRGRKVGLAIDVSGERLAEWSRRVRKAYGLR